MESAPLWQNIVVAAIGPLVTAIVGSLIIGIYLVKRGAREDERRAREEDRRQFGLRQELVQDMARVTISMNRAIFLYGREAKRGQLEQDQLAKLRSDLDELYWKYAGDSGALGHRLRAHLSSDELRREWHKLEDLLAARYFKAVQLDVEEMLTLNSGPGHSGLSVDALRDDRIVDMSIDSALERATNLVLVCEVTLLR
jgi:hypothetical protein